MSSEFAGDIGVESEGPDVGSGQVLDNDDDDGAGNWRTRGGFESLT